MKESVILSVLDDKLMKIATSLQRREGNFSDNYLLTSGLPGISLFFYYYGKYANEEALLNQAQEYFERSFYAIEDFQQTIKGTTLYGGYTGILWVYQHYINQQFIAADEDSKGVFSFFDEMIEQEYEREALMGNYDLLYGFIGYGVYLLERNDIESQAVKLNRLVDLLELSAVKKDTGVAWVDRFERQTNVDGELINLGYAHGIPAIITFLSYVYQVTKYTKAARLMEQAIGYLQSHELRPPAESSFSYYVLNDEPFEYPSRLAWCYGDLGVGYAILKAGIALGNDDYLSYGENILKKLAVKRIEDPVTRVRDACFCHGTAGISYIMQKAFKYTGSEELYEAAQYWLSVTLRMIGEDGSCAVWSYLDDKKEWEFRQEEGLLEGAAGVGLCILQQVYQEDTGWDVCFML